MQARTFEVDLYSDGCIISNKKGYLLGLRGKAVAENAFTFEKCASLRSSLCRLGQPADFGSQYSSSILSLVAQTGI
jgi:hypothetical protein